MKFKKFISVLCAVSVFSVAAISVGAASNYTPSVTKKASVTVSSAVDKDGNAVNLTVIPVSQATGDVSAQLSAALEEIKTASSLKDLPIVGTNPFDGKTKDYTVSNLFDVSLGVDADFFSSGNTVTVTFNVNDLSTDIDSVWLHRYSTDNKWHGMTVTKSGTNSYTTTFTTLSPVAVCVPVDSSAGTVASPGTSVVSPQTSDATNYWFYVVVAACIPALFATAVFARKKLAA